MKTKQEIESEIEKTLDKLEELNIKRNSATNMTEYRKFDFRYSSNREKLSVLE